MHSNLRFQETSPASVSGYITLMSLEWFREYESHLFPTWQLSERVCLSLRLQKMSLLKLSCATYMHSVLFNVFIKNMIRNSPHVGRHNVAGTVDN